MGKQKLVGKQKLGTTFEINGREYWLLATTAGSSSVQILRDTVERTESEDSVQGFDLRADGQRKRISPDSVIDRITGFTKVPVKVKEVQETP